ncbi:MAG: hypothetical protein V1872_07405 [bacterium]
MLTFREKNEQIQLFILHAIDRFSSSPYFWRVGYLREILDEVNKLLSGETFMSKLSIEVYEKGVSFSPAQPINNSTTQRSFLDKIDIAETGIEVGIDERKKLSSPLTLLTNEEPKTKNQERVFLLLQEVERIIEKWEKEDRKEEDSDEDSRDIFHKDIFHKIDTEIEIRMRGYLAQQKKIYSDQADQDRSPGSGKVKLLSNQMENFGHCQETEETGELEDIWGYYQEWNKYELEYWNSYCSTAFYRMKFSWFFDFNDSSQRGECGPYNHRYNILQSMKRLNDFFPEWLEAYFLMYGELCWFEG